MANTDRSQDKIQEEQTLRQLQEDYLNLLDLAPDAFFQGNTQGKIIIANKKASLITGYTNEELLTMYLKDLFSESILNQKPLRYDLLDQGEIVTIEREISRKDGSVGTVEMNSRRMPNGTYQSLMREITERKQIEMALCNSEHLYRAIFENTGTSSIIIEEDTTIALANTEWVNLSGYSKEELEGKMSWTKFVVPEDLQQMIEYHNTRRFKPSDAPRKYEFRFIRRNGEIRNMINSVTIIPDSNKSIASLMDITELKQAEKTLKESEEKLKTIIETSPDGIAITSLEGTLEFATKKALSIWGYDSLDEVIGKNMLQFIDSSEHEKAIHTIRELINGEQLGAEEFLMKKKDGSSFFCESNANILRDANNNSIGILYINRDITERKLAEIAYRESEEKYKNMVDILPDGVIIHKQGIVVFANNAALRIMKIDKEEKVKGRPVLGFVSPEYKEIVIQRIKDGIENNHRFEEIEEVFITNTGENIDVIATAVPFQHQGEKAILTVFNDISDRKKAEKELILAKEKAEESDRLKSAFLANMSHEIRTPMNGILGFADLLKKPQLTGEEQMRYVNIIEKSGNRMLNIINDIIDISKIESGQMKINISDTNINTQMDEIVNFFKPEADSKELILKVTSKLPFQESIIKTDREKVYAIFLNLIKNAIKFTDKGSVNIGGLKKGDFVEFFIEDTGVGIPKERQKVVFERFVQADIADRRAFQGAGLGLSISKAYIEMLGGKIWFESEEHKGSTFYFTLPCVGNKNTAQNSPDDSEEKQTRPIHRLKVLVAEDDDISDMYITKLLIKYNCELLIHATTGIDAVRACQNNPDLDLIMMDIKMPAMNGYEATRQIRQFNTNVIIIAQTAYAINGDREMAVEAGCNDYIAKPMDQSKFNALIYKYFSR